MKGTDGQWYGMNIDLWRQITENLELNYEFREYDLAGLLDALEAGTVDAGVAALTIIKRRGRTFCTAISAMSAGSKASQLTHIPK